MADRIIPITIGPNATLGPSFEINIPRPRDRKTLNKNDEFRRLRSEVIGFLNEEKRKEKLSDSKDSASYPLPDIAPAVI